MIRLTLDTGAFGLACFVLGVGVGFIARGAYWYYRTATKWDT